MRLLERGAQMARRLLGMRSPSAEAEAAGRRLMDLAVSGMEQGARETAGMTWDERVRHARAAISPETLAYAEGVAKRSFPALYDDDEGSAPGQ